MIISRRSIKDSSFRMCVWGERRGAIPRILEVRDRDALHSLPSHQRQFDDWLGVAIIIIIILSVSNSLFGTLTTCFTMRGSFLRCI